VEGFEICSLIPRITPTNQAEEWERYHSYVSALTSHLKEEGIDIAALEGSTYQSVAKVCVRVVCVCVCVCV
jgi:ribosomal protein S12 methylthiotransferase accessory factor YcaO